MPEDARAGSVAEAMSRINRAWIEGRVGDMNTMIHDEMIMVLPGFSGRII